MLRAACCVLRAVCCVLRTAYCVLHAVCCVLHAACCMLFAVPHVCCWQCVTLYHHLWCVGTLRYSSEEVLRRQLTTASALCVGYELDDVGATTGDIDIREDDNDSD